MDWDGRTSRTPLLLKTILYNTAAVAFNSVFVGSQLSKAFHRQTLTVFWPAGNWPVAWRTDCLHYIGTPSTRMSSYLVA